MKKLLIVVDMQNDFIDGALGTKEAQQIVPKVVEKIKSYSNENYAVIYTMDTHHKNYLETQEGKYLPVSHCILESKGWQLQSDVKHALYEAPSFLETEFQKGTFGSLDLANSLLAYQNNTDHPIEAIELVGLCTDICVISNALLLKATFPELPISVDASCCAGVTPESHENALKAMKMCQIQIIS